MPQKTRKEKQIAELRRKLAKKTSSLSPLDQKVSVVLQQKYNPVSKTPDLAPSFKIPLRVTLSNEAATQLLANPKYIISDLKKTFFLTGIVLFVELLLYWALEIKGIHI